MMRRGKGARAALVATILSVVITLSAVPASVGAQAAAPTIQAAELKLWPEYDDPGLLVIFSGQFAPTATFPLQVAFPVPAGARNIQATYRDAGNSLINLPYEVKDGKLSYELPSPGFHVEYYVDRTPSGEQRDIAYTFEAPYAIDAFNVSVQEPARASSFTMTPAAQDKKPGSDGLTDHQFSSQNLAAGEKVDIGVAYSKADTGLSAPQLAVAATGAPAQSAAGAAAPMTPTTAGSSSNLLPWLLIGLGLALLAGVLLYWLLTQRRAAAATPVPAAKSRPVQAAAGATSQRQSASARPTGSPVSFCTNCGHPLKSEDRFCSQCGAPRRA